MQISKFIKETQQIAQVDFAKTEQQRERDRERQKQRQKETERDRQTERDRKRDRERQRDREREYVENKLKENIAKPKDLWKLKSLSLSIKFPVVQTNVIEDNTHLKYDLKSVAQTFAKFDSNLAQSLLMNLSNHPYKFDMNSIH